MTDDHVFIDSLGQTVRGREKIRAGWLAYFALDRKTTDRSPS
jgi:ketosteroid isomerase-like protein